MADTLHLQIVTPDRLLVREDTEQVQIPGKNGELGILPGHAPLITELQIGEISYRVGTTMQHLAVAWGFAEVLPDKVTILAAAAERAEDIDVKRAKGRRPEPRRLCARAPPILTMRQFCLPCGAPRFAWLSLPARDRPQPRGSALPPM